LFLRLYPISVVGYSVNIDMYDHQTISDLVIVVALKPLKYFRFIQCKNGAEQPRQPDFRWQ